MTNKELKAIVLPIQIRIQERFQELSSFSDCRESIIMALQKAHEEVLGSCTTDEVLNFAIANGQELAVLGISIARELTGTPLV